MIFAVMPNKAIRDGRLVYRRAEYSFDTESRPNGRGISVSINEVQLFVDDDGRVIYVSGYCPFQGWGRTALGPPGFISAGLVIADLNPRSIQSGMAFGLNDLSSRWAVYVNPDGWVCVGNPEARGEQAIEFAPGSVAVLKGDTLVALWLHPAMVGAE